MSNKEALLPGTLELMILQSLRSGALHGYAILHHIELRTGGELCVEEGSLYPALHRMEQRGWMKAAWGRSESNRRARFYSLTPEGRQHLRTERRSWNRLVAWMAAVLDEPEPGVAR